MTYCWVIVDAPWVDSLVALEKAARRMPLGSRPLSVQKVRFSAAITASWTCSGTVSSGTLIRFWSANRPSSFLPLS